MTDFVLDNSVAMRWCRLLNSFPIAIDREGIDRIRSDVYHLAGAYAISGYDAAYLELGLRKNLPLATLDRALQAACLKAGGVILSV